MLFTKVATMSNMKCPICGEKIEHIEDGWCNCKNRCLGSGSISLWQELIRTRKALELAVDALNYANKCIKGGCVNWETEIDRALEQITAEQKDVK